ncbi:DUF1287 domain-containing protein [Lysobacter sp. CA199]|uniref:DUF1287 domain-containing protein n=1 Tax=Lysobacter sp. CA199 TaxID=3455608 RepID=UPI003F8D7B24
MRHGRRRFASILAAVATTVLLAACSRAPQPPEPSKTAARNDPARSAQVPAAPSPPLVAAARAQIGVTRYYDPAYVRLAYPGGDVAAERGVCTDVVIRALRTQGIDLQQTVHEDMRAHFASYPTIWRANSTDRNIDHRRVPNLQRWFERQRWSLPVSDRAADYRPGDLVTWELRSGVPHIGIVSDRKSWDRQRPLMLHNIARGTQEDDVLFDYTITGHYRPVLKSGAATAAR